MDEDTVLILKAKAGDAVATDAIIDRYTWLARSVVRKYFTTNCTEEDLVQEGCLGIAKGIQTYDPDKNPNLVAYFSMCIDANIKDALRMATRRKHRVLSGAISLTSLEETGASLPAEFIYDPVHNYIEREGLDLFYRNLSALCSPFQLQVLHLYLEGYTYAEIAAVLRVTAKKVDNALAETKKKIKQNPKLFE